MTTQTIQDLPEEQVMLLNALVALKDIQTAHDLLQDLCTPRELEDIAQRLKVARMLDAGISYANIQGETGASATTVARVARCLKYGPGGYRAALDAIPGFGEEQENASCQG